MIGLHTRFETALASRYLAQLCKHFAHKITVSHDDRVGHCAFLWGTCQIIADGAVLSIRCEAATDADVERIRAVVEDHVLRFAWREKPVLSWQREAAPVSCRQIAD